jgi:hypothetical protein
MNFFKVALVAVSFLGWQAKAIDKQIYKQIKAPTTAAELQSIGGSIKSVTLQKGLCGQAQLGCRAIMFPAMIFVTDNGEEKKIKNVVFEVEKYALGSADLFGPAGIFELSVSLAYQWRNIGGDLLEDEVRSWNESFKKDGLLEVENSRIEVIPIDPRGNFLSIDEEQVSIVRMTFDWVVEANSKLEKNLKDRDTEQKITDGNGRDITPRFPPTRKEKRAGKDVVIFPFDFSTSLDESKLILETAKK